MNRLTTTLGSSIACAALLAAGASGALAAKGPGKAKARAKRAVSARIVGYGTLSALSANAATITTPGNTSLSATLAPGASYTARSQAAAIAGLKVGDQVVLRGRSVNGATTVTALGFNTGAFAIGAAAFAGTVGSAGATSLTVTRGTGQSVTVALSSTTRYIVNGTRATTPPALAAGQKVRVLAKRMTDGSIVAVSIWTKTA